MRAFVIGTIAALAMIPASSRAQSGATAKVRSSEVRRLESALADDSMEGRLTGSPGGARGPPRNPHQL